MWFEILPTLGIMGTCLVLPDVFIYFSNKLFIGNAHKRRVITVNEGYHYLRDSRMTSNYHPYSKQLGLDDLFPKEESEKNA